jgi:hypothetical protein
LEAVPQVALLLVLLLVLVLQVLVVVLERPRLLLPSCARILPCMCT